MADRLTSNAGPPVPDNQTSLTAGGGFVLWIYSLEGAGKVPNMKGSFQLLEDMSTSVRRERPRAVLD
jgi:hypothetical protein